MIQNSQKREEFWKIVQENRNYLSEKYDVINKTEEIS